MAEYLLPKQMTRVRFPSPAPDCPVRPDDPGEVGEPDEAGKPAGRGRPGEGGRAMGSVGRSSIHVHDSSAGRQPVGDGSFGLVSGIAVAGDSSNEVVALDDPGHEIGRHRDRRGARHVAQQGDLAERLTG